MLNVTSVILFYTRMKMIVLIAWFCLDTIGGIYEGCSKSSESDSGISLLVVGFS